MRNLKKALALVLALMMTLSLMVTVSASAYPDDNAIEQDEAVSVMSAIGVFNGTDGGKFDPAGNLTRAQAAKIITYMLLGKEVADSLPNTGSKFADCADGRWYVGAVNYLTDLGIVVGRNETTFDPNGNVNGYEFAKMLLGALGYNSKTERFEGESSWSINIATAARRAGLDEGLAVSTISSVALTREQAAKLAFNTLTATMVYYHGGVVVGDVTVNPTRDDVSNAESNHYDKRTGATADKVMQFCEQYFPELKVEDYTEEDDFGHEPNGHWVNGKTEAYVNLADPAVVLTEGVNADGLKKLLPKGVEDSSTVTIKGFGNSDTASATTKTIAQIAGLTADGKQVEIYLNSDGDKIAKVITITYKVEKVTNITEKDGSTNYRFSKTSGTTWTNTEDAAPKVVLAGDVAKGDVVTTVNASGTLYVYPTTKFTGSQTAKKGTTVTIGGAQYNIGTGVDQLVDNFTNSKDEANYWVDMNGYLVMQEGIETEVDINYAVITSAVCGTSGTATLDNPNPGQIVNVRAVLSDGSVEDRTLKTSKATEAKTNGSNNYVGDNISVGDHYCGNVRIGGTTLTNESDMPKLVGSLVGYYIDDDGKMVLDKVFFSTSPAADDVIGLNLDDNYAGETSFAGKDLTASSGPKQDTIKAVFNSKTVFVIYSVDENNKVTAETRTGVSGLKISGADNGLAVVTASSATQGTASVVFLQDPTAAVSDVDYVYINTGASNRESVLKDDGSGSIWKYTGITPDGEEIDVFTSNSTALTSANGLYSYDADSKVIVELKVGVAAATAAKDTQFNHVVNAKTSEELILVDDTWLPTDDDTKVVYVNELDGIAGNNCLIEVKGGKIVTIYVYACQHADTANNNWSKAQDADVTEDCGYEEGDHIQKCGQCGAVIDHHAKPVCTETSANHTSGQTVTCDDCSLTETCNADHSASGDED